MRSPAREPSYQGEMEEGDSRYGLNKINFLEDDVEDHAVSAQYSDGQLEDRDLLEFVEKHLTSREGYPDYYRTILQDLFSTTSLSKAIPLSVSFRSTRPSHSLFLFSAPSLCYFGVSIQYSLGGESC